MTGAAIESSRASSWYGAEGILSWVAADTATRISAADARALTRDTYTLEFVCYLGRFLLNFDASCANWWRENSKSNTFAEFVTSVEYGLLRYPGSEGARALAESLERQHGNDPEKRRHLALAFALLNANAQPVSVISRLLRGVPVVDGDGGSVSAVLPANGDTFDSDPLALLPRSQIPVLNEASGIYEIRGLAPYIGGPSKKALLPQQQQSSDVDSFDKAHQTRNSSVSVFGSSAKQRVFREKPLDVSTYGFFAAAGAVGCMLTHVGVVPLDVVKTRMQTDPTNDYANTFDGLFKLARKEGIGALSLGLGPTIVGYAWYGATVYPGFEFLTRCFATAFPGEGFHAPIVLLSGALATIGACVGACPAETVRIRVVADPEKYATGRIPFLSPAKRVLTEDGLGAFYAGFRPLVVRQVIFGVVKFFFFDTLAEMIFTAAPHLRAFVLSRLFVAFVSGFVAGTFSSLVSQPADAILTYTNERNDVNPTQAARNIWKKDGLTGFYKGALTRAMWSASVISGQFAIYDLLKSFLGVSARDLTLFLDVQL